MVGIPILFDKNYIRLSCFSNRHYIPKEIEYLPEVDSLNTIEQHFHKYFKIHDERPVIIYAHGSDRNRAANGRCLLNNKLRNLGYHVFAVDYRGIFKRKL
jgi:hypothetical protein